jgi:hypothetical protein
MSCAIASLEDLHLEELMTEGDDAPKYNEDERSNTILLPRGGVIVPTSIGNIQIGMPPDTVKDSITLGVEIPIYYVVPAKRFDFTACLNISEFEFPAYFNFFVRKTQICLICTPDDEMRIRTVFQETLLGPLNYDVSFLFAITDSISRKTSTPRTKRTRFPTSAGNSSFSA